MLDKSLQEQTEKVASKDSFPINWVDRITLFISHTIKYLIPVIVIVMMYEIFMRYIIGKPTHILNILKSIKEIKYTGQIFGTAAMATYEIAETKMPDLNANDVEAAMNIIAGSARNMGIVIED